MPSNRAHHQHVNLTCLLKSLGGRPRRFGVLAAGASAVKFPAVCIAAAGSAGGAPANCSGSVLVLALPPMLPLRLVLRSRWLLAALLRPFAARHLRVHRRHQFWSSKAASETTVVCQQRTGALWQNRPTASLVQERLSKHCCVFGVSHLSSSSSLSPNTSMASSSADSIARAVDRRERLAGGSSSSSSKLLHRQQ